MLITNDFYSSPTIGQRPISAKSQASKKSQKLFY